MNLLFDGNYFGHRTLHVVKYYGTQAKENHIFLDDSEDQVNFIKKLHTDFTNDVRKFPDLKRVIYSLDSRSWRKKYLEEYKATRVQEREVDKTNWSKFYELLELYGKYIEENFNVYNFKINNSETDDNIYLWSKYLLGKGESMVFISTDKDLYQIVEDTGSAFTTMYNNHSQSQKLILPNNFSFNRNVKNNTKSNNSSMDIFDVNFMFEDMRLNDYETLENIYKDKNLKLEYPDINKLFLEKILLGDSSDNIIFLFKNNKNEDIKLTRRHTNYIYKELQNGLFNFNEQNIFELLESDIFINKIFELLSKKVPDINKEDFDKKIQLKKKLILINETNIPEQIQNDFKEIDKQIYTNTRNLLQSSPSEAVKAILNIDDVDDDNIKIFSSIFG